MKYRHCNTQLLYCSVLVSVLYNRHSRLQSTHRATANLCPCPVLSQFGFLGWLGIYNGASSGVGGVQPCANQQHFFALVLTVCYLYNRGNKYVHSGCWDDSDSFFEPHTCCTAHGSSSRPVVAFFTRLYLAHLCHLLQY